MTAVTDCMEKKKGWVEEGRREGGTERETNWEEKEQRAGAQETVLVVHVVLEHCVYDICQVFIKEERGSLKVQLGQRFSVMK